MPETDLPTATVRPSRRPSLAWIVPLLATAFAVWLGWQAWAERGIRVVVCFDEGHGIATGDPVRYRGIAVGAVTDVRLAGDRQRVEVEATLHTASRSIASEGSRFWVVRPRLGVDRIGGLDTLIGPRYLEVRPGDGPRQQIFDGLNVPPTVETIGPEDLQVVVRAATRAGLSAGAPVLYRGVPVGTVMSVGLESDAGAVAARLHIQKPYVSLIRPETRFWPVGGVQASVGLTGVDIQVDSLRAMIAGGIVLATPPNASDPVMNGHRFTMSEKPEKSWLEWAPLVAVGSELLPVGAAKPQPLSAVMVWRQGLLRGRKTRSGWVIVTEKGILGPLDLLQPAEKAREGSAALEVAGQAIALDQPPAWSNTYIALRTADIADAQSWTASLTRMPEAPEDCLIVADPTVEAAPIAAARMSLDPSGWRIGLDETLDEAWHGAAVLARIDGALIGMLLIDDGAGLIVPVSGAF